MHLFFLQTMSKYISLITLSNRDFATRVKKTEFLMHATFLSYIYTHYAGVNLNVTYKSEQRLGINLPKLVSYNISLLCSFIGQNLF